MALATHTSSHWPGELVSQQNESLSVAWLHKQFWMNSLPQFGPACDEQQLPP
jgi:hypothetical protein